MCRIHDFLEQKKMYNWDGDRIIYNSTIANTRSISNSNVKYEIDIRELLLAEHNTVVKSAIQEIKDKLSHKVYEKFNERKEGSFDFKVRIIKEFVEQSIEYKQRVKKKFDAWLFPDETLTLGFGDCEDRAILMASLVLAVGVSPYNIRVSLGYVENEGKNEAHAWMMYKNEKGRWEIIEPNDYITKKGAAQLDFLDEFNYKPSFVFNRDHLWGVYNGENNDELANADCFSDYLKRISKTFNPSFASAVHTEIVLESFKGIKNKFLDCLTAEMKAELVVFPIFSSADHYINRLASKVNAVDITLNYNALDHFDNSQIQNSLVKLNEHLLAGTIEGLAKGIHALQDFYSHTSFAHFAKMETVDTIKLAKISIDGYDLEDSTIIDSPVYDGTGTHPFDFKRFKVNQKLFVSDDGSTPLTPQDAITFWKEKIVSGRYGQPSDSRGLLEGTTQYVDLTLPHLNLAAGVPHHEDMAVDKDGGTNALYPNAVEFSAQFRKRKDAAIRHTKQIVLEWINLRS